QGKHIYLRTEARGRVPGAGRMAPRRFQPSILPDRHARDSEKGAEYRHSWTYMVVWGQGGSLVALARCGAASSSPRPVRMTRAGIRSDGRRKPRFGLIHSIDEPHCIADFADFD